MSTWLSSSISTAYNQLTRSTTPTPGSYTESDAAPSTPPPATLSNDGLYTPPHHSFHVNSDGSVDLPNTSAGDTKTPRTRAADSQILSSILESHPSFSVFRKGASDQSHETPPDGAPLDPQGDQHESKGSDKEEDGAGACQKPRGDESVEEGASEEWHLSSVEDMASLQFGDRSASLSPPSLQHSAKQPLAGPSVHLLPNDSPPPQTLKRRTSQLEFSPIQLAPSPLLSHPAPPPPPPTQEQTPLSRSPSSSRRERTSASPTDRRSVRTILKLPRTPGTGQSVRFTASTRHVSQTSPESSIDTSSPSISTIQENSVVEHIEQEDEGGIAEGASMDNSDSHSSQDVVSFLSRLQAAIPSPNKSLSAPPDRPRMVLTSPEGQGNPFGPSIANESNIFDTSAPKFSNSRGPGDWSVSDWSAPATGLGASTTGTKLESMLEESEEESENHGVVAQDVVFQNANSEEVPLPSPPPTPSFAMPTPKFASTRRPPSPRDHLQSSMSSPAPNPTPKKQSPAKEQPAPLTRSNNGDANTSSSSRSSNGSSTSSNSSRVSNTFATPDRTHRANSFYRQFLAKRAEKSVVAADELGRIVELSPGSGSGGKGKSQQGEPHRQSPKESPLQGAVQTSSLSPERVEAEVVSESPRIRHAAVSPEKVVLESSPLRGKRRAAEMEEEERVEEVRDGFRSPELARPALNVMPDEDYEDDEGDSEAVEASLRAEDTPLSASIVERSFHGFEIMSPIAEVSETSMSMPGTPIRTPARSEVSQSSATSNRRLQFFTPKTHRTNSPSSSLRNEVNNSSASREVALFSSTSSHIPTTPSQHRRSHSDVVTASPNPFASQGGDPTDLGLIHSLLSAQGDMLANTSTQRFLLSSLITNLRGELDRKDAMLRNVQSQNEELEAAHLDASREAEQWERLARERLSSEGDVGKVKALEELIVRLTTELETRTANERRNGALLDEELRSLRHELQKARSDSRDSDIRVRHAQADQGRAEDARIKLEREADELRARLSVVVGDAETFKRERDDLRARLRSEIEERDYVIGNLRADLSVTRAKGIVVDDKSEDGIALIELQRELEQVRLQATREHAVLDAELKSQWQIAESQTETISELREQARALKEELAEANEVARKTRAAAETARLESRTEHSRLRSDLAEAQRKSQVVEEAIEDAQRRIEEAVLERNNVVAELEARRLAWEETLAARQDLEQSVSRIETDAADKITALAQAQNDLEQLRRDMNDIVDARDRRLASTEAALATRAAKCESLQSEGSRLHELVKVLRQESADREVKIVKLRKVKMQLGEDVTSLNIALESKQQETDMYKRQLSTIRHQQHGVAPTPARSAVTNTGATARVRSSALPPRLSASLQQSQSSLRVDTPSKVPSRNPLSGAPSSSFSKARRAPSESYSASGLQMESREEEEAKENASPRRRLPALEGVKAVGRARQLVAA